MKLVTVILTIAAFLVLPAISSAQNENIRGIVQTAKGVLVVWNEPGNNFTLEAKGSNFENIPNQNVAFMLGGKFLQVVVASVSDVVADSTPQQKLDDNQILIAHQVWETKYIKDEAGMKPKINSEFLKLSNGKTALLWSYRMSDKPGEKVERQVFLTVVKGEQVLVLNGNITPTAAETAVRTFLLDTMQTLRTSTGPLSQEDAQRLARTPN